MTEPNAFESRCETLFAQRLGYGRRWKTAAADKLGIGRATLYRYFQDDSSVAADVLAKLDRLEAPGRTVRSDRDMVALAAKAVVDVQERLDVEGWLSTPYPPSLRRILDLGAARNLSEGQTWPTNLNAFVRAAQEPLVRWIPDMSWDLAGEFFGTRLIEDGEATTDCRRLAIPGGDPEQEIDENLGYEMLIGMCRSRADGDDLYRAWRKAVIDHVTLTSWSSTLLLDARLASVERIDEIVEAFYDRVPESLAINGLLPVCTVSGTILRRDGRAFHTECRQPEAIRRAREGRHDTIKYRSGMLYLKRAFRTFWVLPGLAELELERRLAGLGWSTTLWPGLDQVDLLAIAPDGRRRIAVDLKDYYSPTQLAGRFEGFKTYQADHDCFLVIPDYVTETDPGFEDRFEAFRASVGKAPVELRTVSDLVAELART